MRSKLRTFTKGNNHFKPGQVERETKKRTAIKPPTTTNNFNEKKAFDSKYSQVLEKACAQSEIHSDKFLPYIISISYNSISSGS